jgi:hypothetical protein
MAGNTNAGEKTERTVRFKLENRAETNYCQTGIAEFSLFVSTKVERIDSLQGFDAVIVYDPSKISITQALRLGTISSQIPTSNFAFRVESPGVVRVYGYILSGVLTGEGPLFGLRCSWKNAKCADTTAIKLDLFDPAFEFGIDTRNVIVDSFTIISNRQYNQTAVYSSKIEAPSLIVDTVSADQFEKEILLSTVLRLGEYAANEEVKLIIRPSKLFGAESVRLSTEVTNSDNLIFVNEDTIITVRKVIIGKSGSISLNTKMLCESKLDTIDAEIQLTTANAACDCLQVLDTSTTRILLTRVKKDTVISGGIQDEIDFTSDIVCTEYYDLNGRLLQIDCPDDNLILLKKSYRRRVIRHGNLIKILH